MRRMFAGALIAAVMLSGCAPRNGLTAEPIDHPLAAGAESAAAFAGKIGGGIAFDYEPTRSPGAAKKTSDLIVDGTVTDLRAPSAAERTAARESGYDDWFVLVVDIDETLDGDAAGTVQIVLPTGPGMDVTSVRPLAVGLRVIAGLTEDDESWQTAVDGLWFQGAKDTVMHGPYAEPWELQDAWGGADTIDEYAAAIREA